MTDSWRDRLSEYLDGELDTDEVTALEAHLELCDECREELESLRLVVGRLDTAPDRGPARDLWPELLRRIDTEEGAPESRARRPGARSSALRLAASLTGVAVLATLAWQWLAGRDGDPQLPGPPAPGVYSEANTAYDDAASAWSELLAESTLPQQLATPLRAEMQAFEQAIEETRKALAEDPSDADLKAHLTQTLRAQMRFMSRVEEWTGGP